MAQIPEKRSLNDVLVNDASEVEAMTSENLIKYVDWLERASIINREHRTKYADDPEKFMDSEANLDQELKRFEAVATEPQLLPKLTSCARFFETLLPLLMHENSDISSRIVTLLADLIEMDEDISPEKYDDLFEFCEVLLKNQLLSLLVDNMTRLDEADAEHAEIVFKSLGIVESLMEVESSLLNESKSIDSLQKFLVNRYYDSEPSQNRDYAAELTSMLIASVPAFRDSFCTSEPAIDLTLAAVAPFKDRDPKDADESEYFENLFDILCAASLEPKGQERFLQAQGVHLLVLLLKQVNLVRIRALKLLSYVVSGPKFAPQACEALVEALGLKVIFPILMKKGEAKLVKLYKTYSPKEEEEFLATILAALVRYLGDSPRIKGKFEEAEGEKVKQVISLYHVYKEPSHRNDEDERECALFTFRQLALILQYVFKNTSSAHLITFPEEIKNVILEFKKSLDSDDEGLTNYLDTLLK